MEIPNDMQYVKDCITAYELDAPMPAIPTAQKAA
jgi:hypothetical protein